MKRTLVNGLGHPFVSKTLKNSNTNEQMFLYKHNFKKIDSQIIKKEIEVYKKNAEKSKAAKTNYRSWKTSELVIRRNYFKNLHMAERVLIQKGLLTIGIGAEEPEKLIANKTDILKFENFEKNFNKTIIKAHNLSQIETEAKLAKTKAQSDNEKKDLDSTAIKAREDIKKLVESFGVVSKAFLKGFESVERIDAKKTLNTRLEAKKINRELRDELKLKRSMIRDNSRISTDKFKTFTNISIIDKLRFSIYFNARRFEKNKVIVNKLKGSEQASYDLIYKLNKAEIYVKNENLIINQKLEKVATLNQMKLDLSSRKDDKDNNKIKLIKKEILADRKKEWAAKKIEMKAGSASKRAKSVEKKKIYNHYSILFRENKLKFNKEFNAKNNIKGFRNQSINAMKLSVKIRENSLRDALLQTPVETSKMTFWSGIILGTLFPGIGSIFVRKYTKGIIQIIGSSIVILILAWIFGAFPSHMGNGIMGLINLGADSSTASSGNIGTTAGIPNDGRFYLVVGTLAIILLLLIVMYWIISVLDNINQANSARLGMRPSNWKDQRKMLKSQGLPYLLSLPAMIFILFIVLLPLIATILISFTNFGQGVFDPSDKFYHTADGIAKKISWVGGDQFRTIFVVMGPELKGVLVWTIIWTFGATLTLLIIGTFFALIVNQSRIKFKTLFRIIYILPWAVPAFITILYFSIFFQHDGPFNRLLGIDTDWGQSGSKTKMMMIFMQGWLGHSYIFLLVTGMLQSIPKSLYEASRIDGASSWKQFTSITAPIILSKIAPLIIGQFVFNFNNFGLIYLFNNGGIISRPGGTAGDQDIFISWIYKLVNGDTPRPGAAAAMSLFISVFTVTPSAFMFARSKAFKGDM